MNNRKKLSIPLSFSFLSQLAFWSLLLISVTFFSAGVLGLPGALIRALLIFLCHALVFYAFYAIIIPRYYEHRAFGKTALFSLLVFLIITPVRFGLEKFFTGQVQGIRFVQPGLVTGIVLILFSEIAVGGFASLLRLAVSSNKAREKVASMQRLQLETELRLLRAQLNPHFLFNTINNLYALALEKSDKTPDALLKLSGLLRYLLYESNKPQVPLEKEWEALLAYAELVQLRFEKPLQVSFVLEAPGNLVLEPLLLMPLLENCYKHSGIGLEDGVFINVNIRLQENRLIADFINPFKPGLASAVVEEGGIGLSAVERRMKLRYPDEEMLLIQREENIFKVRLIIPVI